MPQFIKESGVWKEIYDERSEELANLTLGDNYKKYGGRYVGTLYSGYTRKDGEYCYGDSFFYNENVPCLHQSGNVRRAIFVETHWFEPKTYTVYYDEWGGSISYTDGYVQNKMFTPLNNERMKWDLRQRFSDFYVPSLHEMYLIYRQFKPTTSNNYTGDPNAGAIWTAWPEEIPPWTSNDPGQGPSNNKIDNDTYITATIDESSGDQLTFNTNDGSLNSRDFSSNPGNIKTLSVRQELF